MNYLIHPTTLFNTAQGIKGFSTMLNECDSSIKTLMNIAEDVAESWSYDWDPDEGFGSSDRTFMLKDYIDKIIGCYVFGKYKTQFGPYLEVAKV